MRAPAAAERATLPSVRESFVGRERELLQIRQSFDSGARLVTLVGPPGAGKTRLAVEHARHADRALFCDMTDTRSAESMAATVAASLSAHVGAAADVAEAIASIGRTLDRRDGGLVVLDNLEHVIDDAASLVGALLNATTTTRFLCTSREALRIAGEQRVPVGGMDEDDAVALYDARARAVDTAHAAGAPKARELVRRLDALPLAIELAAARAHLVPAAQMLDALERPLEALRSPKRDARPMHASLRRAIESSWTLLSDHERDALAQCSVFRGGFDLDAADAVIGSRPGAPSGREIASALVDRSLLRVVERGDRFRIAPYDAVAAFARERLDELGTRHEAARRHAAHFVRVGEQRVRPPQFGASVATLRWLAVERENLIEAHRAMHAVDPALSARAVLVLGPSLRTRGPKELWHGLVASAVDAAERSADRVLEARTRIARAEALSIVGDLGASDHEAERALMLARRAGARGAQAAALLVRASVAWLRGDVTSYDRLAEEALALASGEGPAVEAWALGYRAGPLLTLKRFAAARPLVDRALALASAGSDDLLATTLLAYAGVLALYERRPEDARVVLERAVAICRDTEFRRREGELLHYLAQARRDEGAPEDARRIYGEALEALGDAGYASYAYATALDLAALEIELGARASARTRVREVLTAIASRGSSDRLHGLAHAYLAALFAESSSDGGGEDAEHARHLALGRQLAAATGDHNVQQAVALLEGVVEVVRSKRAAMQGEPAIAAELAQRARSRLRAAGEAVDEAHTAARILGRAVTSVAAVEPAGEARLRIGPDARWFAIGGHREELGRRGPPRRLLRALAELRLARPGDAYAADELIAIGWPDEKIQRDAASMRLYTTVRLLRKLGLEGVLLTRDDGYLLDPSATVAIDE